MPTTFQDFIWISYCMRTLEFMRYGDCRCHAETCHETHFPLEDSNTLRNTRLSLGISQDILGRKVRLDGRPYTVKVRLWDQVFFSIPCYKTLGRTTAIGQSFVRRICTVINLCSSLVHSYLQFTPTSLLKFQHLCPDLVLDISMDENAYVHAQ